MNIGSLWYSNRASVKMSASLISVHGEYSRAASRDSNRVMIDALAWQSCQIRDRLKSVIVFCRLKPGFQKKKLKMYGTRPPAQACKHFEVRLSLVIRTSMMISQIRAYHRSRIQTVR